jgi:hypothetical protein
MANTKILTCLLSGKFFQRRDHDLIHGTRHNGASDYNRVPLCFVSQSLPNLPADTTDIT